MWRPRLHLPVRLRKRDIKYIVVLILTICGAYTIAGDSRVVDADTLRIGEERVRLLGVDAPETKQTCRCDGRTVLCGERSAQALTGFIGESEVSCEGSERDKYGRITAECFIDRDGKKINLNAWLVEEGHAMAYRYFSEKFVENEERAKAAKKGIWACSFDEPWEYRKKMRGKKTKKRKR